MNNSFDYIGVYTFYVSNFSLKTLDINFLKEASKHTLRSFVKLNFKVVKIQKTCNHMNVKDVSNKLQQNSQHSKINVIKLTGLTKFFNL